jgi:hypothetical protein
VASSSLNLKAPHCTPLPDPSTKPNCGYQYPGSYSPSVDLTTIFAIIGGVFSAAGTLGSVLKALGFLGGGATYQNCFFVAAVAALVTWFVISTFYWKNCVGSPSHPFRVCSAGVIQATFPAFSSVSDQIFAFAATHDRIDVVLKSIYWAGIFKRVDYIRCSPNDDPPYDDKSPMLWEYYHNDAVCRAGLGGSIGALVGGVAGAFVGAYEGLALSCGIFGPFAWLCALIALIVAIIIAVVSTLLGGVVGSQIGRVAGPALPAPPSGVPVFPSSLSVGDYVTTYGNLTENSGDGTLIYWFVDSTYQHGCSPNKPYPPFFSYTDPDANFAIDACCIPSMPPQGQGPIF